MLDFSEKLPKIWNILVEENLLVPLDRESKRVFDAAITSLNAQGLFPGEFAVLIRKRILSGEIDANEAIKQIKECQALYALVQAAH